VCIEGIHVDGHKFAFDAVDKGAAAILCKKGREGEMPPNIPIISADDTRLALAFKCKEFFGDPSGPSESHAKGMKLIGITGTNGKTSTTAFIENVLIKLGKSVGSIGTLGTRLNGFPLDMTDMTFSTSTTPDTIELYQILTAMQKAGSEYVVMEVSSHALALHKVAALNFALGIFTNLTQDHLDFHGNMENYRLAKAQLFDLAGTGIINYDDKTRDFLLDYAAAHKRPKMLTYGLNGGDYHAANYSLQKDKISYIIVGTTLAAEPLSLGHPQIEIPIPGKFNIYNSLCTFAAAHQLGFNEDDIAKALKEMHVVDGRIQTIPNNRGFTVIVDYAHSPDGLENIITACREFTKGRIITVFGCGGDRDSAKRPIMGEVAGRLSDYCIITSDNPRNENPASIIAETAAGLFPTGCEYDAIIDRKEAISAAILKAKPGDCVIIAGKGHETYQEFENGRRVDFDDAKIAREILSEI
jgi:UDP-N-acetylmuramoyl-L-alanyl-D-glutamate--2,6-diaminopimelate ligase